MPRVQGLPRERLSAILDRIWEYRLCLIVAPAGSGKTTVAAQFSATLDCHVAWYRADSSDAESDGLLCYLERAFADKIADLDGGWRSSNDAVRALENAQRERVLLIVDDLHALEGTPAEGVLEHLMECAPPNIAVLAATRSMPAFNVSRLRVSGDLLELGPEDLRFRSWEVERLFREFYAQSLTPEDLALLSSRTEGWAAGLQMFHLATQGKSQRERSQLLAAMGSRSKLVREYLTRNVLDELPAETRAFLMDTCTLGLLDATLCDGVRGQAGSAKFLRELERRRLFTTALDDDETYRYHEGFRSHLVAALVEEAGEDETRRRFKRAGGLLEAAGAWREALHAYCRAEDEEAASRLLGRRGDHLAGDPGQWIRSLPSSIVQHDPWLVLATARNHRAAGRWTEAIGAYRRAETVFGAAAGNEISRSERLALAGWLGSSAAPPADWTSSLRDAVNRRPLAARQRAAGLSHVRDRFSGGLAALLGGHAREARTLLDDVADDDEASTALALGAGLAAAIASLVAQDPSGMARAEATAEAAERAALVWVARMARAALALGTSTDAVSEAAAARHVCQREGDPWGAALAALFEGWGRLRFRSSAAATLEAAASEFRAIGAQVLEAWALALLALDLARGQSSQAPDVTMRALRAARRTEVPGAEGLALRVLADLESDPAAQLLAEKFLDECGIAVPTVQSASPGSADETRGASVSVRCFGGFQLAIHGRPVDLSALRPRARALLRLLALRRGRPGHREVLVTALWPDVDNEKGIRNLQVALSTIRHVMDEGDHGVVDLQRDGDAYALHLPDDAELDILEFERSITRCRLIDPDSDRERRIEALRSALSWYAGDLLPEDGPAEWVVVERERYRTMAAEASCSLADALLALGDHSAAVEACAWGLRVDRFRDELWRVCIRAYDDAGDRAEAERVRRDYVRLLNELGVEPESDERVLARS